MFDIDIITTTLGSALKPLGMACRYVPTTSPECEDDEVEILGKDGKPTGISVQLCAYGREYAVGQWNETDETLTFFPSTRSLSNATKTVMTLVSA